MGNTVDFVKLLIEAERYKGYEKDYWGGCDLVIVSENAYKKRKDAIENWKNTNTNRRLIKSDKATSVIWLIETLKPYINYDYLSKYDYYLSIATVVEKNIKSNDKELLIEIIKELEKENWIKENISGATIIDSKLNTWLKFGMEHNDPFFVKFMTLWFAFNKEYSKFPGVVEKELRDGSTKKQKDVEYAKIKEFCEKNMDKLLSVHDLIFKSPLIIIFKEKPVEDMKSVKKWKDNKNESHQEKYYKDLIKGTSKQQTIAIFQMMYQVRCNLFHGSKTPNMERDLNLVRNSGEILEIYLKAIM
ncbi:MAG: hypothetical protein MJ176_05900 [Treponema sp.]|nr:hypothetical protein [Treponema sp.]